MKTISILFMIVMFGSMSAGHAQNKAKTATPAAKIEILYFHATNRCPTCLAVENNAKKTIDENFKTEVTNGTIKFVSLNIDDKANKPLVDKYEVAFSTLLIIKKTGGKEIKTDFTDIGFQYARNNPSKYAELLKAELKKNLM
jgi:hypothetical protein